MIQLLYTHVKSTVVLVLCPRLENDIVQNAFMRSIMTNIYSLHTRNTYQVVLVLTTVIITILLCQARITRGPTSCSAERHIVSRQDSMKGEHHYKFFPVLPIN